MNPNFALELSDDDLENKNTALGAIIRKATIAINTSDIPGELQCFGTELPISTLLMRKQLSMSQQNFSLHFKNYKVSYKDKYNKTLQPLISFGRGQDIYTQGVYIDFVAYMSGKTLRSKK